MTKISNLAIELESSSRKGFILHMITATGILRKSFPSSNARNDYKKYAVEIIEDLFEKVDDDSLTNESIRKGINNLTKKVDDCSWGLAQKGINVALKYYCFVKKSRTLYEELDCPLDSIIMSELYHRKLLMKHPGNPEFRLKQLDQENYENIQKIIENSEEVRILADKWYEDKYQNLETK